MMSSVVSRLLLRCKPAAFFSLPSPVSLWAATGGAGLYQASLLVQADCAAAPSAQLQFLLGPTTGQLRRRQVRPVVEGDHCFPGGGRSRLRRRGGRSRYVETVPYTDRIHLIVRSTKFERWIGDRAFRHVMKTYGASNALSPESVRVQRITCQLVRAIRRCLVVGSLKQGRCPDAARRQRAHLDGLDWEAIILLTGCLDLLKTDAEIASIVAHEVAHVVARHAMERDLYGRRKWIPSGLLRRYLRHSDEIEADRIGVLPATFEKMFQEHGSVQASDTHPSSEKRMRLMSQDKTMEEALELYRWEVRAVASLCLTLKRLATGPWSAGFPSGQSELV